MVDAEKSRNLKKLNLTGVPRCSANSLSPMTDLAHNLGGLSTGCISTPKRRFSWSNISTPGSAASEDSMFLSTCDDDKIESPSIYPVKESPAQETRLFKDVTVQNTSGLNRLKPAPFNLPSTPVTCFLSSINKENIPANSLDLNSCNCSGCQQDPIDTASSQDSGYCGSQTDKECSASSKSKFNWENVNLPRKLRSSSVSNSPTKNENRSNTRCKRFSCADYIEEDFLEDLQANDLNEDTQFPAGISKLLESPLSFSDAHIRTEDPPPSRFLLRKFSEPTTQSSTLEELIKGEDKQSFKRPDPPQQEVFQIHHKKRRKAISFSCNQSPLVDESLLVLKPKRSPNLQRCHSETDATIAQALQRSYLEPDLIGDFTRPYTLPLVVGRHQDLKSVAPHTVKQLLEGKFQDSIDSHIIVDCRYPYEYEAGHIKGAKNIYTKEAIIKEFLNNPPHVSEQNATRTVVIFHCEFSSERGPNLTRFLRNKDREANKDCYPLLHYPEIYLLNGGYKAFFENCKMMCEPQDYKPMHHKDHEQDLKRFRSKSKSWNAESKARLIVRPGLNF